MTATITPLVMPKWGLEMREGTIAGWLVDEGTRLEVGTPVLDVETDKISNAVEAPDPGLLRRKVAQEGETLPVKALLGVLAEPEVSDAEIDQCIGFYGSPVGQRMADALAGAFTGDNMAAEAGADADNPRVSADALRSDVAAAIPGVLRSLSASDREAIIAFGMTPAGRRISALNPRMMAITAEWISELIANPALSAEFSRQAQAIVGRHMGAAGQ